MRAGQPIDGPIEALVEGHAGLPIQQRAGARVVGAQAVNLAAGWPNPLLLRFDGHGPAKFRHDFVGQVSDAHLRARTKVDHAPDGLVVLGGPDEAFHCVGHVSKVPRWSQAAQPKTVPHGHLHDDGRNHRSLGLPRAVGVERSHGHDRQAERKMKCLGQLVGSDLGGRIRRLAPQGCSSLIGTKAADP